jgi:hypothetical protein
MTSQQHVDPLYIEARRTLLDALLALESHAQSVVVVGAQAIYLRTGPIAGSVAPFTTDADLAIDPRELDDDPLLDGVMVDAGFEVKSDEKGELAVGTWIVRGRGPEGNIDVDVDLLVPRALSSEGRRGARLGVHGNRAARSARGLEAALLDHEVMTIASFDPNDDRQVRAKVAGMAALLVAKLHKLHDRVLAGNDDRLFDKDAGDIYRIMQFTRAVDVAKTLRRLTESELAGEVTQAALEQMRDLFGRRGGHGITMAQRALQDDIDPAQIVALSTAYTNSLISAIPADRQATDG